MKTIKKVPLKFKIYLLFYRLKIFLKSVTNNFKGGKEMANFNLQEKKAVVFGIANEQSIAWHIAKALNDNGVRIALGYQERAEPLVKPLLSMLKNPIAQKCDVVDESLMNNFFKTIEKNFGKFDFLVHSIAFAKKEHLQGKFYDVDKRGFQVAQEVSAFSLTELTKRSINLLNDNGSIITMTYYGSEKVIPNYNIMGVSKAALESSVRYLAYDLGTKGIRVNAISAGPINTLAASGVTGFDKILKHIEEKAPLKRNISANDVADLALFLCSDLSKNITGQVIYVDAGYNIMGI